MKGNIVRTMTAAVPLALLGLTACSDIDNPVGPGVAAQRAASNERGWSVEISRSPDENHFGDLRLTRSKDAARGVIRWHAMEESLTIAGAVEGEVFTFEAVWGDEGWSCSWIASDSGTGSATFITDDRLEGELQLNVPCQEDVSETWELTATRG